MVTKAELAALIYGTEMEIAVAKSIKEADPHEYERAVFEGESTIEKLEAELEGYKREYNTRGG